MIYNLFIIESNGTDTCVTLVGTFSSFEKAKEHIKFKENDDIDHREDEYSVFREQEKGYIEYLIVFNELDDDINNLITMT